MKTRYVYIVLALAIVLGGYVALRVQNYYEARSFDIKVKVRAPVYEKSTYPYNNQSPPNAIINYIKVGSKPNVKNMTYDNHNRIKKSTWSQERQTPFAPTSRLVVGERHDT
jgi:hypothetical protein